MAIRSLLSALILSIFLTGCADEVHLHVHPGDTTEVTENGEEVTRTCYSLEDQDGSPVCSVMIELCEDVETSHQFIHYWNQNDQWVTVKVERLSCDETDDCRETGTIGQVVLWSNEQYVEDVVFYCDDYVQVNVNWTFEFNDMFCDQQRFQLECDSG